jgi:hypothetical protein
MKQQQYLNAVVQSGKCGYEWSHPSIMGSPSLVTLTLTRLACLGLEKPVVFEDIVRKKPAARRKQSKSKSKTPEVESGRL